MSASLYKSLAVFCRERGIGVHKGLALIAAGELQAIDYRSPGSSRPLWRIPPAAIEAFESRRASRPSGQKRQRRKPIPQPAIGYTEFH
ncbi:MAG: hypothetical protein K2X38_00175 [Gemmataceae bacterium]|nr:hypothetical protein [Gemmataceae bacterium]